MKRFIDLQEAPKTVAFTFGRFNPPTIGHEKLCDAVRRANPSDYKIYASQSQNPKKDPLQYAKKIAYMRQSFPKHKRNIVVSKARYVFEILVELNNYETKTCIRRRKTILTALLFNQLNQLLNNKLMKMK